MSHFFRSSRTRKNVASVIDSVIRFLDKKLDPVVKAFNLIVIRFSNEDMLKSTRVVCCISAEETEPEIEEHVFKLRLVGAGQVLSREHGKLSSCRLVLGADFRREVVVHVAHGCRFYCLVDENLRLATFAVCHDLRHTRLPYSRAWYSKRACK